MATPAPPASQTIDIGRALTYAKDDPDVVKKLLIGSLVVISTMLLIPLPLLVGYYQRTIKRTVDGEEYPLPEWDDWGGLYVDGLKMLAVAFAHVLILIVPVFVCMCGAGALMGIGNREGGSNPLGVVGALGMVAVYAFMFVAMLAFAIYFPAAQARVAITGNLGEAFQTKANIAFIRRNLMNYALTLGVMLIGNTIAQFAIILLCVGILPATVWSYTAFSFALGETVRRDPQFAATGTI